MLAAWIAIAFGLGLAARQVGLPPLVGFLASGFLMNAAGAPASPLLEELAHLGVLLLLFTVGLKLRLKNLFQAEVWGVAILHFLLFGGLTLLLVISGSPGWGMGLAVAGALAFSSTVLAAKILEQKREIRAFHGRVTIGILIVQDVIAVAILAFNGTTDISPAAVLILLLPLLRRPLFRLLDLVGHGELLVLLGAVLALALGAWGFEQLGLSPELGSLLVGMILANHPRAVELGDALWSLKEFFLVGFFLTIGLTGMPTWDTVGLALVPIVLLPVKVLIFYLLLVAAGLSARTAFLACMGLATYSEFGLIVLDGAVTAGLLAEEWLVAGAMAVAVSFAVAAPLNRYAHVIYPRIQGFLKFFERRQRHPDDEPISLGTARAVVAGMGRVGTGAYDHLRELGQKVVGLDSDLGKVERHLKAGRRVVYADAEDPSLWHRLNLEDVQVILLALPDLEARVLACRELRRRGFRGLISATYVYAEERDPILKAGADVTYNYFTEAGVGLAADTVEALAEARKDRERAA